MEKAGPRTAPGRSLGGDSLCEDEQGAFRVDGPERARNGYRTLTGLKFCLRDESCLV